MSKHAMVDDYLKGRSVDLEPAENHLDTCARCRNLLEKDPAVGRARIKVMSQVINDASLRSHNSGRLGPLVALGVAAAVLLLAVPALLLAGLPGSEPEVSLEPAALPGGEAPSSESFVLTFNVGSSDLGWLLWKDSRNWSAARMGRDGTLRYHLGVRWQSSDDHGSFSDTGDDSIVTEADLEIEASDEDIDFHTRTLGFLAKDSEIPWAQLVGTDSPEEQFARLFEGEMAESTTSNPLAVSAAASDDGATVEFGRSGRIVVWDRFAATAFEERPLTDTDIESFNGTSSLDYSRYLRDKADPVVSDFLNDGLITADEYRSAAQLAIDCANDAGSNANFQWDSIHKLGVLDLGSATGCGDRVFNPVDDMFRLQVRSDGPDSVDIAMAKMDEDPAQLEMIYSEIGDRSTVASGPDWIVDVAPRGEGWCIYEQSGRSGGEGCHLPKDWPVPNTLTFSLEYGPGTEHFLGVTAAEVGSLVVRFADGTEMPAITENESAYPLRAFGVEYEHDSLGIPKTVLLYDLEGTLIQSVDVYGIVCPHGGESAGMCGTS